MKFKVGDKVVRTAECSEYYTVKQGCEYIISKVDDEYNNIYLQGVYDNNGQPDWFNHDNFELVEDSHYAIEFDQDKILEDLLAKEVMIEYKGDTVTVDDIFARFK